MPKEKVNVRLQKAITTKFGTVAVLCHAWPGLKSKQSEVYRLVNLRLWPWNENYSDEENFGKFKKVCALVAEALDIFPEKLFPVKLYFHLVEDDPVLILPVAF